MNNYKEYLDLLSKNYEQAVDFLLQKYGSAQDDYFREASYQRFINGEIKSITRGKASRTKEGLYCHHIDEIKWLKISDKNFVKQYNIPFESQRKDRLVYCDLIEHTILHVLITKETSFEFGYPGYVTYLKVLIEEWYLDGKIPNRDWMKACYNKSFLEPQKAFDILKEMQEVLGQSYFYSLEDYYEEKKKKEEQIRMWEERRKQHRLDERDRWIEIAKQLHNKSSRNEIVNACYSVRIQYGNTTDLLKRSITFEEYDSKMKNYMKEDILAELLVYIDRLSEEER
ncbi:hypothetical protein [Salinicoccus kekensis]|uniref:Uncharacterized protein n=1 Tax=Salinicoccus kekensis TaxID=714307 RepID=A0A285U6U8_9STAP|nr:hypothetical protein [Salinicoccus kekensis]SOC37559.1 hypothetical protein SAMN05878391_0007 [Salinicoccus kekensis]